MHVLWGCALTPDAAHIASRLNKAKRSGAGWIASCPAHEDSTPSLSINDGDIGPIFKCHAGCTQDAVLNAIEALGVAIRRPKTNGNGMNGHPNDLPLLTVDALAAAKGLSLDGFDGNHVFDCDRGVSFEYNDRHGNVVGTKYRRYLGGGADRGFSWQAGSKPCLYGLCRLENNYEEDGRIILCEGETDCLTLWQHGFTAVGLPGASMWKDEWAAEIPEGAKVYVILEPDQGGRTVEAAIDKSPLRDRAHFIRMTEAVKDPNALHLSGNFVEEFEKLIAAAEPVVKQRIKLRHISEIVAEKREPQWLIHKVLEKKVLAVMAGPRGSFKSFIAFHWSMLTVVEGQPVVILTAEGGGLDRRTDAWMRTYASAVDLKNLQLLALERAVNLNLTETLQDLRQSIDAADITPALILIDTYSKYAAGIDENDNGKVALFLQTLSENLREVYGCSILIVAHAGHGDAKRPRGAYSLMANPDAEYIVERADPKGMLVSVSRDRFKDTDSLPALGYKAESVDLGRLDSYGDRVTSLIVRTTDMVCSKKYPTGKAQRQLLAELERLIETGEDKLGVWSIQSLRDVARSIGLHKSSARDASLGLISLGIMTATIGGYRLTDNQTVTGTK